MTQTLLVADDSKTVRKIVEMALKASSYEIVSVDSAQAVLNAASDQPNIILLDYYMPDGSGYDVCRSLKANAATANIPIVMLGGTYKNFDENLARQSGADGILLKPFKTDALLGILDKASSGQLVSTVAPPVEAIPVATPPVAAPPVAAPSSIPKPIAIPKPAPPLPTFKPVEEPKTQNVEPDEIVSSTSQARIPVSPAVSPNLETTRSTGSGLNAVAMSRGEIESLLKAEVKNAVKAELPGLLRTILGEVFQQKVLPKLMARADERVKSAIDESLTTKIQEQVRAELEALLAD